MAIDLVTASPVTGGDPGGGGVLTSPTYTFAADTAPIASSKQFVVSALGGTQTGVRTHFANSPFSITYYKPVLPKVLGVPDLAGVIRNIPTNKYSMVTRKGVLSAAGQPMGMMTITTSVVIPAGAEFNDTANVMAAVSAHIGGLKAQDNQFGDLLLYATY